MGLELAADIFFAGWPLSTRPCDRALKSPSSLLSGRLTPVFRRGWHDGLAFGLREWSIMAHRSCADSGARSKG